MDYAELTELAHSDIEFNLNPQPKDWSISPTDQSFSFSRPAIACDLDTLADSEFLLPKQIEITFRKTGQIMIIQLDTEQEALISVGSHSDRNDPLVWIDVMLHYNEIKLFSGASVVGKEEDNDARL